MILSNSSMRAPLQVVRRTETFHSDDTRVITRLFTPGSEHQARSVLQRVSTLSDAQVHDLIEDVRRNFADRHLDIDRVFEEHYEKVSHYVGGPNHLGPERKLLIGAYFTMEYSIEAAALFNPSIVLHPDQSGLAEGSARFLMSLRATGEGHVSSIVFRTGIIDADDHISFDPVGRFVRAARQVVDRLYDKHTFGLKLREMGSYNDMVDMTLGRLGDQFTIHDLAHEIEQVRDDLEHPERFDASAEDLMWLAQANYHLDLPRDADPSEVVIFPTTAHETKGIEDVRLVRFIDDDGQVYYYGAYVAYDGTRLLPQLFATTHFQTIQVHTLNGRFVQNKGMALFPRKINGQYVMISRVDGERLYIMRSENLYFWNEAHVLRTPQYPWEFMQIGNCGSPLETEEGWILLTHGVGPMRRYCIGAMLLDRNNPSIVRGQLPEPLIVPNEQERDGYVPNVVYSCGGMIHRNQLVLPYAMSDRATCFATVPLDQLLASLMG